MERDKSFRYPPSCSAEGCNQPAIYKLGALWSDGTSRELKNYGLACKVHCDLLMAEACARRTSLKVAEGETVGPVHLFLLAAGIRDSDLQAAP